MDAEAAVPGLLPQPRSPLSPGLTTGSASGTSKASCSAAAAGPPSAGTPAQPWPSGRPAPGRPRRMACPTPAPAAPAPDEAPVALVTLQRRERGCLARRASRLTAVQEPRCAVRWGHWQSLVLWGWSFPRFSFPLLPKVPPTCGLVSSVLLVQTPLRGTCCRHLLTQLLR